MEHQAFAEAAQWIVLRCPSSKTLALTRRLEAMGAWCPIWQRMRRRPRSHKMERLDLPAIPSFVFMPATAIDELPKIAGLPYSVMRIDGCTVRITERDLEHLRKIDETPKQKVKVSYTPGAKMKFHAGPFAGLNCKVVYQSARYCTCMVEGFPLPLKIAACVLNETAA